MDSPNAAASCVLIVDDEAVNREVLRMLLTPEGHTLAFAACGREALEKSRELVPDLILLDVVMPGMDGLETCRQLRADPVLADVPIIFITALHSANSRLAGLAQGADDYLCKPIDGHELQAKVRTILKLDRYRKLLAERGKFAWVVEEADTAYLLLGRDGAIEYANRVACAYLNLPPSEAGRAAGGHFLTWVGRQGYRCEPQTAWQAWPECPDPALPRYLVRPDTPQAQALWLEVRSFQAPLKVYQGHLLALHDITAQVGQRQQTWSFHSMISHKLNTPLNQLNVLDFLASRLRGKISRKDWELLEIAQEGSKTLQQQLARILQYVDSRDGRGGGCGLGELPGLLEELRLSLEVAVRLDLPEALGGARLNLAFSTLRAILHELLSNARKAHPRQQPAVEISLSRAAPGRVLLCLSDDGQYLPNEVLDKVWTPYFQHDKYFTGEMPGLGLGLPMVASLVWNAGGECRLRNREDRPGVVVELGLPLLVPQEGYT